MANDSDQRGASPRTRLATVTWALVSGTLGFRFLFDAAWGLAVALAVTLAAFYAMPDERSWGRVAMAISVAAFGGLGAWQLLGLGVLSVLVAALGSASFLAYCFIEDRRLARQRSMGDRG